METPSQILASRTLERLCMEKLLTKDEAEKLSSKFSEGRITSEDWRLAVENSAEKEQP